MLFPAQLYSLVVKEVVVGKVVVVVVVGTLSVVVVEVLVTESAKRNIYNTQI